MVTEDFSRTLDYWIKELEQYDFNQLCAKPSPSSWSMGQVFMHLVKNTNYYIEQIRICVSTDDHENEEASTHGKKMLSDNEFPDEIIEGPPENSRTLQPASKEELVRSFLKLKDDVTTIEVLILQSTCRGKTKHPGLNYFNAKEWLQFADMHFRHHLRQKKRIDAFLNESAYRFKI
jgi:hypothetical protein